MICRSFGVLKQRWRILDHSGGRLCYQPEKAAQITLACFILHNFCRRKGVPEQELSRCSNNGVSTSDSVALSDENSETENNDHDGKQVRASIARNLARR